MVQQVGKYVLERQLGQGAMGSIWLSSHPGLGIKVAVKILDHKLAAEDPDYLSRFIKEGKIAASINHPNVVRILDAGNEGATYYLVMELIKGSDAKALVEQKGEIPVTEVLDLAICTTKALSEAHKKGIVHRDIKPDNILVTNQGRIKLADLGIAKQMGEDYGTTMTGTAIGTPFYIAPEQAIDSSTVDGRCDIYSLGATMYHLLTGSLPYPGTSAMSILMKHVQEPLEHPKKRRPDLHLPDKLCTVICKMMEKNPDDRYQTCDQLLSALDAVKNKKSTNTKKKHFSAPLRKKSSGSSHKAKHENRSHRSGKYSPAKKSKKKPSNATPIIAGLAAFVLTLIILLLAFKPGTEKPVENKEPVLVVKEDKNTEEEPVIISSQEQDIDSSVIGAFGDDFENSQQDMKKVPVNIAKSKPITIDAITSKRITLGKNFSIFCEFKAENGVIFSKTSPKEWAEKSVKLSLHDGKVVFSLYKGPVLESTRQYIDGQYHRVLLKSSEGHVSLYIDGEEVATKYFSIPDNKDFRLNIATTGIGYLPNLDGHLKHIAFWNSAIPNIRIKELFRGGGTPESADFYYSEESYNPASIENRNLLTIALKQLEIDNPGLKVPYDRVKIDKGNIKLNLGGLKITNGNALQGLKLKVLNLWAAEIKDSSFLKDIKLEKLRAIMLKSGSISVSHLNPEYLRELTVAKSTVTDLHHLKKFNLKAINIDYQEGLIANIKHMPVESLEIINCPPVSFNELNKDKLKLVRLYETKGFKDISSLRGCKLKEFHISKSELEDISVLKEMPLERVSLCNTKVKDLSPLSSKNITTLIVPGTSKDLYILKSLKSLEKIAIPKNLWTRELAFLRDARFVIEGYDEAKRPWYIAWGNVVKNDSRDFWEKYEAHLKVQN